MISDDQIHALMDDLLRENIRNIMGRDYMQCRVALGQLVEGRPRFPTASERQRARAECEENMRRRGVR